MFKLVLEKAEEPEIKLPTSAGSWKKQESSRKTSISALLTIGISPCLEAKISSAFFFSIVVYKVMLKILQARLQQYVNQELPDVQAGFRKGRGTRDQFANIHWIIEKATEFHKKSISALLAIPKPLTVWITINCGKF